MQTPVDLVFFQDLFQQYYRFTLENSVYAICLAVSVWLLVVIFYSLKISLLKGRHQVTVNVGIELQNQLAAAQAQILALGEEIAAAQLAVAEESQRLHALEEHNNELAAEMVDAINVLAAEPDLAQQGLSVKEGLGIEQLWQRYSIAVKQLCEKLLTETANIKALQQAQSVEIAKLAEKDLQLQAAQLRIDSQKQQHAKLEELLEEQKALHQTDLARLADLERQADEWVQSKASAPVTASKNLDQWLIEREQETGTAAIASEILAVANTESTVVQLESKAVPEDVIPVVSVAAAVETAKPNQVESKSKAVNKFTSLFTSARERVGKLDDKLGGSPAPAPVEIVKPVEVPLAVEPPKPILPPEIQPEKPKASSNKFVSLFASARDKISKLDEMLGDKPPVAIAEEISEELVEEAKEILEEVRHEVEDIAESSQKLAKDKLGGLGGLLKNPFASSQKKPVTQAEVEVAEISVAKVEEEAQVISAEPAKSKNSLGGLGNSFKNLLGNGKQKK